MSFPRYPKYKASGVEWLGEVPEGWEAKPLKYSTLVYTGNSLNETEKKLYESTDPEALPYISSKDIDLETHEVQYENGLRIPKGQCGLKVAPGGSFLLCVEGGSAGRKVALLRLDVCFVNKLCCFSSRQNNKFRFYFSQSQNFKDKFGLSLTGLIGGVSTSLLKNFQIPTPSDSEQTAIAEFLDRETGKIDGLVAEQRRLMELLKEKRQAVISHAVTKGLNPHAPMKPSGIEWLGDVPEHWDVGPVKRFFKSCNTRRIPLSGEERGVRSGVYPYYGASGIIDHIDEFIFDEDLVLVSEDGANLLNRASPIAFVATGKYWVNNHAHILRPLDSSFLFWAARIESIDITPFVTGSAQPKFTSEALGALIISVPPAEDERAQIQRHIVIESSKFDTLTAEAQRTIDLLQERRTALISAAVTGQIDVRQHPKN